MAFHPLKFSQIHSGKGSPNSPPPEKIQFCLNPGNRWAAPAKGHATFMAGCGMEDAPPGRIRGMPFPQGPLVQRGENALREVTETAARGGELSKPQKRAKKWLEDRRVIMLSLGKGVREKFFEVPFNSLFPPCQSEN